MLRARLPLAVALLAATLFVPAAAASAASTPDPSASATPNSSLAIPTTLPTALPTTLPTPGTNPAAGTPLEGLGDLLTDPSQLPSVLTGLGTCLQSAGTDPDAGQGCIENFLTSLGIPGADCFSKSGFTVDQALAKIEAALSGGASSLTPETLEQNLTGLGAQVQQLVTCLTGGASPSADTGTSSGGGAEATPETTSTEAPAAVAVTGTPNFTG